MEIVWPGTWLLVAFFVFVTVGVFGPLAWSLVYSKRSMSGRSEGNGPLMWLHLVLFEVGVLGATAMMAAIGFVGGSILAQGGGVAISSEAIRTQIIPPLSTDPTSLFWDMPPVVEAVLIGVALLSQLFGYLALFTMKKGSAA
jgi:hypothetical protein